MSEGLKKSLVSDAHRWEFVVGVGIRLPWDVIKLEVNKSFIFDEPVEGHAVIEEDWRSNQSIILVILNESSVTWRVLRFSRRVKAKLPTLMTAETFFDCKS